jgi:hypothetical protein
MTGNLQVLIYQKNSNKIYFSLQNRNNKLIRHDIIYSDRDLSAKNWLMGHPMYTLCIMRKGMWRARHVFCITKSAACLIAECYEIIQSAYIINIGSRRD